MRVRARAHRNESEKNINNEWQNGDDNETNENKMVKWNVNANGRKIESETTCWRTFALTEKIGIAILRYVFVAVCQITATAILRHIVMHYSRRDGSANVAHSNITRARCKWWWWRWWKCDRLQLANIIAICDFLCAANKLTVLLPWLKKCSEYALRFAWDAEQLLHRTFFKLTIHTQIMNDRVSKKNDYTRFQFQFGFQPKRATVQYIYDLTVIWRARSPTHFAVQRTMHIQWHSVDYLANIRATEE